MSGINGIDAPDEMNSEWARELDRVLDVGARGVSGVSGGALHHVGIAVPSIHAVYEAIARSIGAEVDSPVLTDPLQKVSALFLFQPSLGRRIELIEPVGAASPITRFLQKTGGGVHHLCFKTDDLDAEMVRLKSEGARVVCPPVEACGFHGARIAFCYTRERVLLELAETPVTYDRVSADGKRDHCRC
ncbi:MAG: VOC family protein [Nitrospiraceae bacterium]|nr:VOC family protein [Nitrospiraceae bacterium]